MAERAHNTYNDKCRYSFFKFHKYSIGFLVLYEDKRKVYAKKYCVTGISHHTICPAKFFTYNIHLRRDQSGGRASAKQLAKVSNQLEIQVCMESW